MSGLSKFGTTARATAMTIRSRAMHRRLAGEEHPPPRGLRVRAVRARSAGLRCGGGHRASSLCLTEPSGLSECEDAVEHDRADDEHAHDGPLPEVLDPEDRQRAVDREQQVGADRGTPHAADAARDGDAADHGRADRLQLPAGAGARADRAVPGRVEDAGESRERAAHDEGGEDAPGHPEAVEVRGVGVGADRVELATAAQVAQVPGRDDEHDRGDDREERDAEPSGRCRCRGSRRAGRRR